MPPSTASTAPVTNAAASDARYAIALATSSGRPGRGKGCSVPIARATSLRAASSESPAAWKISVGTIPGDTTFTRTPSGAHFRAIPRLITSTAPLLARYTRSIGRFAATPAASA